MNLEQIERNKVIEAEELFIKLGLDFNEDLAKYNFLTSLPIVSTEKQDKKNKLIWTRLSSNSNIGCIVE